MKQKQKVKAYLGSRKKSVFAVRLKLLSHLFIVMSALFIVAFIISINDLSIKGFVLQDLKFKVVELEEGNRELELLAMKLESYENISERAEKLSMIKVEKIEYITVTDEAVAKK
ncbi:hypothetical protein K8R32_02595 [bacterium]|nr:hypothetical protein [bacterium]